MNSAKESALEFSPLDAHKILSRREGYATMGDILGRTKALQAMNGKHVWLVRADQTYRSR